MKGWKKFDITKCIETKAIQMLVMLVKLQPALALENDEESVQTN